MKKLNSINLKQVLWETLQEVKTNNLNPSQANAVASQSREILRIVNAEIRIAQITGKKPVQLLGRK